MLNTNSNNFLKSSNEVIWMVFFATRDDVDQNKIDKTTQNVSTSFSYSEPLTKQISLQFALQLLIRQKTTILPMIIHLLPENMIN
jgi:hypothetical protein